MSGPSASECSVFMWGLIAILTLALIVSLIFNISHYVEKKRQDKVFMFSEDYIPRDDEYYIEDTPIYGNLDNTAPESTDENCYEQMKARPERSMHKPQKDTPLAEAADEAEMCYASLDHSCKDKGSKPRKKKTSASNTHEDEQLHGMSASVSTTTLTGKFLPESQAVEENIHDDPVRLFGLIRAKNDQTN